MTTTPEDLKAKFWKALKHDRTIMLGLSGDGDGMAQPMTAQIEGDEGGPIWIFTAKDTDRVQALGDSGPAFFHFSSKGHDLFAAVEGELATHNDPATIDRLWNPFVAAWFEGGQTDPNLQLLRFEPGRAQIWLNEHSLFAGVKMLLGKDPKSDYQDKVAEVRLS
ncbi:MAG: pyridoxamine 5'-phosphate oxidase family protein [Phenylobacterium sp.]